MIFGSSTTVWGHKSSPIYLSLSCLSVSIAPPILEYSPPDKVVGTAICRIFELIFLCFLLAIFLKSSIVSISKVTHNCTTLTVSIGVPPPIVTMISGSLLLTSLTHSITFSCGEWGRQRSNKPTNFLPKDFFILSISSVSLERVEDETTKTLLRPLCSTSFKMTSDAGVSQ